MTPPELDEQLEHRGAGDGAEELGHPVARGLVEGLLARDHHRERDGGVDVRAADRAEGVRHHDEDEAEGHGDRDHAGGLEARDGGADRDEDEEERADELGDELAGHGRNPS